MAMWKRLHLLRKPEGDGSGGGGSAAPAPAVAPAAPAPAPAAPAPSPAAPAAPAPSPAAPAASPAAPAPSPAAPAPAPKPEDTKGFWPENWRETVSKEDAKRLTQLQRYASPEAAIQALFAAQDRIRSGELKPVLGKNPSADELKEWREAHGVPAAPDKYDLGKDVKIEDVDKPMFDVILKAAHDTNQSTEQVKATVKTFYALKKAAEQHAAEQDRATAQASDDALRAEWGGEFRRNINLVHGLLDFAGSQELKDSFLDARLPDGKRMGDSPEAMKMLVSLALIQNPTGTVVPGGGGENGETIKSELEKLQKIPAAKKTEAQSERQRGLIDSALKAGFMNEDGTWKRA